MLNFTQFKHQLLESFQDISLSELTTLSKSNVPILAHFSDSPIFPPNPNSRGGMTAYNVDLVGAKIGRSVTKPKSALFFWFLKDINIPNVSKGDRKISGLFSKRTYLYLAGLPTSNVLKVSDYTEQQFEKDISLLKSKGYDLLQSKLSLEFKDDLLDILEFRNLDTFGFSLPKNLSSSLTDLLSLLWQHSGRNFTQDLELFKVGPAKVRTLPETAFKQLSYFLIAQELKLLPQDILTYKQDTFDKLSWVKKYQPLILNTSLPGTKPITISLDSVLQGKQLDIEQTQVKLKNYLAKVTKPSIGKNILKPDQYISVMNQFIEKYSKKSGLHFNLNHPAWKLWLTVLFFSLDPQESWINIWKTLGYTVIIDDDPQTQIVPGLEKIVVSNLGGGESGIERILSRIDNEGVQVVVLDATVLKNVKRFNLQELSSQ